MIHTAEAILKEKFLKQIGCEHNKYVADGFDEEVKSGRYNYAILAINEARKQLLQECIDISQENYSCGCNQFTEPQLKKLLDQIK